MALNADVAATQRLLQNPLPSTGSEYLTADLTTYINTVRDWAASISECIRDYSTLTLTPGTQQYNFSSIVAANVGGGVGSVLNIKTVWVKAGNGQVWIMPRSFPWFSLYNLNNVAMQQAQPETWSQFDQGVNGSLFLDPIPDQAYVCQLDTVCLPIPLVDDTTAEALPYPWTDAVPFGAAYYALMSAQREADAELMKKRFDFYVSQSRRVASSSTNPEAFAQYHDPTNMNKLGSKAIQPSSAREN